MSNVAFAGDPLQIDVRPDLGTGQRSDEQAPPQRPRRVRSEEHKRKNRENELRKRADRKARGLCIKCAVPSAQGHVHCESCLADRRYHERHGKSEPTPKKSTLAIAAIRAASRAARENPPTTDFRPARGAICMLQLDAGERLGRIRHVTSVEPENERKSKIEQVCDIAGQTDCPAMTRQPESSGLQCPCPMLEQQGFAIKPTCIYVGSYGTQGLCYLSGLSAEVANVSIGAPRAGNAAQGTCHQNRLALHCHGGMAPMVVTSKYPTVAPWPGPDDGDEGRTERGWHIAASTPFVKVAGGWITPSQSDPSVYYRLAMDEDGAYCNCPDLADSCKHIRGLEFALERERHAKEIAESLQVANPGRNGFVRVGADDHNDTRAPKTEQNATLLIPNTTLPTDNATIGLDVPVRQGREASSRKSNAPARGRIAPGTEGRKRRTYQQDWPAYNAAQQNEKFHLRHLLADLVALIDEPLHEKGRRPYSRADQVFALVYKIYTKLSWRRFDTDLREVCAAGFMQGDANAVSLARYMQDDTLTPILHDLLVCSALPMKPFERNFAIDGTGFSSDTFSRWFTEKWGDGSGEVEETTARDWVKLHLVCGTDTQIVTAAEVSEHTDHDNRYFKDLTDRTAEHFDLHIMAADKGYLSRANFTHVEGLGAVMFSPFKSNTVHPRPDDDSAWARMYHWFMSDYDGWKQHYHQRSKVESVFSTIKRLFGDGCPASTRFADCRRLVLPVHLLGCSSPATLLGCVSPVAGDVEFQDDSVVDHPVNRRGGGHGVGEDALPLGEDQVGRDAQGPALVAFGDQGEEDLGLLVAPVSSTGQALGEVAQVVQEQEVEVVQLAQLSGQIEVALGGQQVLHQPVGRCEEDGAAGFHQAVAQGAERVGLAGAGETEGQHVDAVIHETALGQMVQLLP